MNRILKIMFEYKPKLLENIHKYMDIEDEIIRNGLIYYFCHTDEVKIILENYDSNILSSDNFYSRIIDTLSKSKEHEKELEDQVNILKEQFGDGVKIGVIKSDEDFQKHLKYLNNLE